MILPTVRALKSKHVTISDASFPPSLLLRLMAENGLTTPERIEQQRRAAKCTPTKQAMAQVLHDVDLKLSFVEIAQRSQFKQIQPRTINDNYNLVKAHGAVGAIFTTMDGRGTRGGSRNQWRTVGGGRVVPGQVRRGVGWGGGATGDAPRGLSEI